LLGFLLPGLFRGPLRLQFSVDDGPYTLGDEMSVAVEVSSKRDAVVEEGRVDLVCEERWAETWIKPEPMGRSAGMIGRGTQLAGPTAPKREVKEFTESFVHSTAVFGEGLKVRPDTIERLNIRLQIAKDWPPHAKGGTLSWSLVVVARTPRGRGVQGVREIEIVIPQ
jgi:hypothetical protein